MLWKYSDSANNMMMLKMKVMWDQTVMQQSGISLSDTHDYRTPSSTTDLFQTFRYIGPRLGVVLPLSAAGDRRGCAGPLGGLGLKTGRGFGSPIGCYFSGLSQTYN